MINAYPRTKQYVYFNNKKKKKNTISNQIHKSKVAFLLVSRHGPCVDTHSYSSFALEEQSYRTITLTNVLLLFLASILRVALNN